jgi:nitroreductase
MELLKQLNWRYACKKFDSERTLTSDQIDRLKEAFNLTATSYGLQPLKLVVIENKELQSELVAHSYNQQQVGQASALLLICTIKKIDEEFIRNYFELVKSVRNNPDDVIAPFRESLIKNFSNKTTEEKKTWAKNQAYIAMGNLLAACAADEIDSCPMEGFIPKEFDRILELESKELESALLIPVGFRAEDDLFASMKKVRKPLEESCIKIS